MEPEETTIPRWRQRPRPVGFEFAYRIEGGTLFVEAGGRTQQVPLASVTQLRFVYAPSNISGKGFRTELRTSDRRKITFGNLSWRSLTDLSRDDAGYRAFVEALAARIAAASPQARFVAGRGRPVWLTMTAVGTFALLGIGFFSLRAFQQGESAAGWVGLGLAAASLWQVVPMIRLNRPRDLPRGEVPDTLVPRA